MSDMRNREPRPITARSSYELIGTARNHEARRKRILRDLHRLRSEAERTIKAADQLSEFFSTSLDELHQKAPVRLRRALLQIFDMGIRWPVSTLLGADGYGELLRSDVIDILFGTPRAQAESPATVVTVDCETIDQVSGEVDWTRNPFNEEETRLRAAIIRQVESKHTGHGLGSACFISADLRKLKSYAAQSMGSDLREAVKKWETISDEESEVSRRTENVKLLRKAQAEENREAMRTAAASLPENVVLFRSREVAGAS